MPTRDPDLNPDDCEGLYRCTECKTSTAQSRSCPFCGGEAVCDG